MKNFVIAAANNEQLGEYRRVMAVDVFNSTCARLVQSTVLNDVQIAKKYAMGTADSSQFNAAMLFSTKPNPRRAATGGRLTTKRNK